MRTYRAEVYRDRHWYMIRIPEIDGLTQARNSREVELMARDLIAITLDVPIENIAVEITRVPAPEGAS